jgi:hypothetical protein
MQFDLRHVSERGLEFSELPSPARDRGLWWTQGILRFEVLEGWWMAKQPSVSRFEWRRRCERCTNPDHLFLVSSDRRGCGPRGGCTNPLSLMASLEMLAVVSCFEGLVGTIKPMM